VHLLDSFLKDYLVSTSFFLKEEIISDRIQPLPAVVEACPPCPHSLGPMACLFLLTVFHSLLLQAAFRSLLQVPQEDLVLPAVPLLLSLACLVCLRPAKDFHLAVFPHPDLPLPEQALMDMRSDECHFCGKDEIWADFTHSIIGELGVRDKNWENGKYCQSEILRGKRFV
jgi:hypothetical protein